MNIIGSNKDTLSHLHDKPCYSQSVALGVSSFEENQIFFLSFIVYVKSLRQISSLGLGVNGKLDMQFSELEMPK